MKAALLLIGMLAGLSIAATATADWYPYTPANDHTAPSAIGLWDWNGEPAGKHGHIQRRGDKLFYNGEEIKLWGTNTGYSASAPDKEVAERTAALWRKFGLNALRHHKHLDGPNWQGFQSQESFVEFDPEGLARFDYFNKCLKDNGIYILLSPTFGVKFGPGDFDRIPYHAEIGTIGPKNRQKRIRAPFGMVYLAREIGDLQIEQTVKVLEHTNPHTGVRYADDPFVFCVELFNEDSVLFSGTNGSLRRSPTIRRRTAQRFSEWLLDRYGSEDAWRNTWGEEAVIANPANIANEHLKNMVKPDEAKGGLEPESPSAGTVLPWAHPWFNDMAMRPGSEQAFLKQRLLDSMEFLIGLQDEFYGRFIEAIRETGFEGEIVTSNWQAGSLVGHLLNLHSDAQTGLVDRHNYFGGGRGAFNRKRRFKNASALSSPGGGNLSVGFQQVADAAFMLSEWTHVQPNEWYAEGPPTMAAYGWGLQGWDISYIFAMGSTKGRISGRIGNNPWDAANPLILGTFPAVSRMVRRMDVEEAPETHYLNAHVPSLLEGRMSFRGRTVQHHDEKVFRTDKVPPEALAATRVAVNFRDRFMDTEAFDLGPYLDGETVVSATKQLRWTPGEEGDAQSGHVTINTAGTKGFVGFAPGGVTFDLGDGYAITPEEGFSVVLLSARGIEETLESADQIILTTLARGRNTGMELNEARNRIVQKGEPPLLMEPVRAELRLPFSGKLDVLDHDGIAATASRDFARELTIDGATDQTPFYLVRK